MQDSSPGTWGHGAQTVGDFCFLLDLPFGAVVLEQRQTGNKKGWTELP